MPAKNAIKIYVPDAYYHIYNRGVNKRTIFKTDRDYKIFLSYLKLYLSPTLQGVSLQASPPSKQLKNYSQTIDLIAYKLMPNHFHLLIHQSDAYAITGFVRSLLTKYVRYFNTHHQRVGSLFQDTYKAILVETEMQLIYLTKYIHRNGYQPTRSILAVSKYSSYPNYLGIINQTWVKPSQVLEYFSSSHPKNDYQAFVEEADLYFEAISQHALDDSD